MIDKMGLEKRFEAFALAVPAFLSSLSKISNYLKTPWVPLVVIPAKAGSRVFESRPGG